MVLAAFSSVAVAQDSVLWLDARDNSISANTNANYNAITAPPTMTGPYLNDAPGTTAGKRGAAQVLRIEPLHNDNYQNSFATSYPNLDADGNRATGNLWVYMDVIDDPSGTNDVISSVGIDFDLTFTGTTIRNTIASLNYVMNNDGSVLNSLAPPVATPWNGVNSGAQVAGSPPDWTGAKAVAVPVTTGPVYSSTNRVINRVTTFGAGYPVSTVVPYRLGRLRATGNTRNCTGSPGAPDLAHANNSTYNVFMKVNNLLITRVFETNGDATESVSFGLAGGTPHAVTNGSTSGATDAVADAIIQVRMKGDFTGDGRVTSADNTAYSTSASSDGTDNESQAYNGDYTVQASPATIGNLVTTADTTNYLASFANSTSCP